MAINLYLFILPCDLNELYVLMQLLKYKMGQNSNDAGSKINCLNSKNFLGPE